MPGTFGHFRSDKAHAQGEAESSKSFLALWNRPKLVLQTLGKLAIRLQALDRKLNVPGTFEHFNSDQAHAQSEAQSSKGFLALWNRPKLVLQTLGKLANRLQALDRKLNVPETFGHFRSFQAHLVCDLTFSKETPACPESAELVWADSKVPGNFYKSGPPPAHAPGLT